MSKRNPIRLLLLLAFLSITDKYILAQLNGKGKVDDAIYREIASGGYADFIVLLSSQADLTPAKELTTKEEKGRYVYQELSELAVKTQPRLWSILDAAGVSYQSFHLVNAIRVVGGDLDVLEQLASLSIVKEIQSDPWVKFKEPEYEASDLQFRGGVTSGLEKINAPVVWEMGFKGQGVVIAGQDTGYDWEHPSLRDTYRGWQEQRTDHNYNWHDAIHDLNTLHNDPDPNPNRNPCGLNSKTPCDDHNHGTHTMGTMVGNDASGTQIGVAPAARWIGCRNMDRGYGRPSTYLECFEWFLAPTNLDNNEPDPGLAPHVINNSWGCPDLEGCNPSNWALMEQAVENLRAAGIVVVVSAGNDGIRGCSSISDAPAFFEGSLTVGSITTNDGISGFSSRGPVSIDGSGRLKPNVVAPGQNVRSATRNGGYASWSGTSMAGPHVAGAVAIIISANPQLAGQVEFIESILEQSAVPMNANGNCEDYSNEKVPNPIFGYGRIDLLAAVEKAQNVYIAPNFPIRRIGLQVFPNPVNAQTVFQINEWPGTLQLLIIDAVGREIMHHAWTESDGLQKKIDLGKLPKGMYFFKLINEKSHWNGTLVKQ